MPQDADPKTEIRAIVFDLDGTLVDSVGDLTAALQDFLAPLGFPAFTDADIRRWMGTDADDIIAGLMADYAFDPGAAFDLAAAASDFLDFYDVYPHGCSVPFDGAAEVLRELTAAGLAIGVCTNKREALSRAILTDLGLIGWIGALAGCDTTDHKKPHPAPLLHVLDRLHIAPRNAIMVGDSINDILVGRASGTAYVVGADYGYPRRPEDLDGADYRIKTLTGLRALEKAWVVV